MSIQIYGQGWCTNCDENTVLRQYESKLIYLSKPEQWDTPIDVYCEECGYKHTATPREYFKHTDPASRLLASKNAVKELDHMRLNVWYALLNKHLSSSLIKLSALTSGNVNHSIIKDYAIIGEVCSDFLYEIKLDKNYWVEDENAYPQGCLVSITAKKNDPNTIREIDEYLVLNFLYHGGIDLNSYPYSV